MDLTLIKAEKNGYKDGRAWYKLMKNAMMVKQGKTSEMGLM